MTQPRTIVSKIWDDHVVTQDPGAPAVLAVDLHLIHEVTSPQAFSGLRARGLSVRHPGQTVATADHSIPTTPRDLPILDEMAAAQVRQLEANCAEFGIPLHGIGSPSQGIVHVIGPQLGLTQPGMTIVCGDSHTSTTARSGRSRSTGPARSRWSSRPETRFSAIPDLRGPRRRSARPRRECQGHHPQPSSRIARGDRHVRVPRRGDPGADHGTAHDDSHEPSRAVREPADRPDDTTSSTWPTAARPGRCRLGRRGGPLARPAERRRRDLRQGHHDRRGRPRADGHLRHQPGHGHPDHRQRARPTGRPTRPSAAPSSTP